MVCKHMGRMTAVGWQAVEGHMPGIEHHEVGLLAHGQTGNGAAGCLGTAGHRPQGHGGRHLGLGTAAEHIALAQVQALAVFEHQQLFGRVDRGVAVRANAPAAAMP